MDHLQRNSLKVKKASVRHRQGFTQNENGDLLYFMYESSPTLYETLNSGTYLEYAEFGRQHGQRRFPLDSHEHVQHAAD